MAAGTLECLKQMAEHLSAEDQLALVEHVVKNLREKHETEGADTGRKRAPQDLYGIWRDRFPPNVDLDRLLHKIRHEWAKEWPEVFES
jgi:hypothetical protein